MARGTLRIYVGAAPGVGKTWAMLDEGHRRAARGTDVVVAAVDDDERCQTARTRRPGCPGRLPWPPGAVVDVATAVARRPAVALVDDLGRLNPAGAAHEHRWQDVDALLDAGIDVVTTLDIGQLASLADVVERDHRGAPHRPRPRPFVRRAEQVELVDMSPDALRRRLAHGNVFPPDRVDAAMANAFRRANLAALREIGPALDGRPRRGRARRRDRGQRPRADRGRAHRRAGRRAADPPRRAPGRSTTTARSSACTSPPATHPQPDRELERQRSPARRARR